MNNKLANLNNIKEIMKKYQLGFVKSLGQNFLKDIGIVEDIIEASELDEDDSVLEIGPGIGVMTYAFASVCKHVTAIEIDKKLIPALNDSLKEFNNVDIINDDFLNFDLSSIESDKRIIANLPYYITTPIIMKFLEEGYKFKSMTVMMQKEVAKRIVAKPGNKDYGILSIAVQFYTNPIIALDVPRYSFVPEPDVDSSVVHMTLKEEQEMLNIDRKMFFRVVRAAFSTRRKTLLNALSNNFEKRVVALALENSQIDSQRRAETLSIEEFGVLTNSFISILS
jgi:16S rRNA (adenine1518-N6/adenine1519-N6)-dimethyltransferase